MFWREGGSEREGRRRRKGWREWKKCFTSSLANLGREKRNSRSPSASSKPWHTL